MTDATKTREPPISFRLGMEREPRFLAFREREKLGQSEALHTLIDAGLDMAGFPNPKESAASKIATHIGPTRAPPGSRLKQPAKTKERWKV